jgi:hypothetical protein
MHKQDTCLEENGSDKPNESTKLLSIFNAFPAPIIYKEQLPRKYSDPLPVFCCHLEGIND